MEIHPLMSPLAHKHCISEVDVNEGLERVIVPLAIYYAQDAVERYQFADTCVQDFLSTKTKLDEIDKKVESEAEKVAKQREQGIKRRDLDNTVFMEYINEQMNLENTMKSMVIPVILSLISVRYVPSTSTQKEVLHFLYKSGLDTLYFAELNSGIENIGFICWDSIVYMNHMQNIVVHNDERERIVMEKYGNPDVFPVHYVKSVEFISEFLPKYRTWWT